MTSTNNNVNMNDLPALVPIDDAPIAPPKPLFAPSKLLARLFSFVYYFISSFLILVFSCFSVQPWTGPRPKIDIKVTSAVSSQFT